MSIVCSDELKGKLEQLAIESSRPFCYSDYRPRL